MLINYLTLKKRLSSFKTKLIKLTNREREFQVRDLTEKNQEITQRNQFLKMNSKNNLNKRDLKYKHTIEKMKIKKKWVMSLKILIKTWKMLLQLSNKSIEKNRQGLRVNNNPMCKNMTNKTNKELRISKQLSLMMMKVMS